MRPPLWSWASAAPMAVETVDARDAPVGPHRDAVSVQSHQGGVAHRVGGTEHQLVARAHRRGNGGGDMQAGGQWMGGQLLADDAEGVAVGLRATPQPVRVGNADGVRAGSGGRRVARDVRPARSGGQREDRDSGIGQQRRHRPVQRRTTQHDHLPGAQGEQGERVQRVRRGRSGRLGDGGQPGQIRMLTSPVSGDDHGVGGEVDAQRLVERHRRGEGPGTAVRPARRHVGGVRVLIGHQGLPQRDVELHRPRVGRSGPGGSSQDATGRRSPLGIEAVQPAVDLGRQSQADRRTYLGAKVSQLLHGLIRSSAEQLIGPVGAEHDQRNPGVVRLDDRRP